MVTDSCGALNTATVSVAWAVLQQALQCAPTKQGKCLQRAAVAKWRHMSAGIDRGAAHSRLDMQFQSIHPPSTDFVRMARTT
jgi:hypothetical protein